MKRYLLVLVSALAVIMAGAAPTGATPDDNSPPTELSAEGRYVVLLEQAPLVAELGKDKVTGNQARVQSQRMVSDQDSVASRAGVNDQSITYNYTYSLNGFSAKLNQAQVAKLRSDDRVQMVIPDVVRHVDTDSSANFLGLTGGQGAYSSGLTGKGVVVGVIDTGIWPEHPSFADRGMPNPGLTLDETNYPACDFGNTAHNPNDAPFTCNNKLVGARQILPTYRDQVGADAAEFDSARDDDGHGTHTASTAAGNSGVQATILGNKIGKISGIAPDAHIIAYKGLGTLGGFGSDLAAAIDQAVADGVDVINYSVGSASAAIGPDDIAFLFAADAGVHVATSAGNAGSDPGTIGSPAAVPWVTSVGASTQKRFFQGTVRLGNGKAYKGASLTQSLGRTELVDAQFATLDGSNGELCLADTLDPAKVTGKIVLCKRGATGRVSKAEAVAAAGGVGIILYNAVDVDNLFTDSYPIPGIHIDLTPGLAIKSYIANAPKPVAQISTVKVTSWKNAPTMTIFSSRGPNPLSADIIKPDITAPGFQVVAGVSPMPVSGVQGELFAAYSGTSMSSPETAGLMALIDQAHPDWSPAAVRSALMTTASQKVRDNDRVSWADPFDMGAGHVNVGKPKQKGSAFNPGLVYDQNFSGYLGFICDVAPDLLSPTTCSSLEAAGIPTNASDLNYPSMAVGDLAGSQVVTRTVTSVSTQKGVTNYTVKVDSPAGYKVEVTPKKLRLKPGEEATFQVRITNVGAPAGEWRHGSFTWKGGGYSVRSPLSVRGTNYAAPGEVSGSGETGSASIPVTFGYSGAYTAAGHGLEPATVFSGTVKQDPDQSFSPDDVASGGAVRYDVQAQGDAILRIAMPPDAVDNGAADIDIFVFGPGGGLVASSTSAGTDELIDLVLPDNGTYQVYVHGWAAPNPGVAFNLYTWLVSATPGGNLKIDSAPGSAKAGSTQNVDVSWAGATAGEWHLGAVSHSNADGLMGLTLVDVDNR